jgi:hypothetical protein
VAAASEDRLNIRRNSQTKSPAGRAAIFDYVLRPAGFIGHRNVRSSLSVAGGFGVVQKKHLVRSLVRPWGAPLCWK